MILRKVYVQATQKRATVEPLGTTIAAGTL